MRKKGELAARAMHKSYQLKYGQGTPVGAFVLLLEDFNKELVKLLLEGVELKFPHRVGTFYVEKRKVNYNHLKLDYGYWRKTGEKAFHTNRHSDGFQAYFHWRKLNTILPNKTYYRFTPTRGNSRALAQVMLEEGGHKCYQQYQPLPKKKRHAATSD